MHSTRVTLSLAYLEKKAQFLVNISLFVIGPIFLLIDGPIFKKRSEVAIRLEFLHKKVVLEL